MKIIVALITCLFASYSWATDYAACKDGKAYKNSQLTERISNKDWICKLKPSPSNPRCVAAQKMFCEKGSANGPHDVPNGGWAWFMAFVEGVEGPIRCTCGCFQKDTEILAEFGLVPIAMLLNNSRYEAVSVLNRVNSEDPANFALSEPMKATHFTTGPELEAVYRFYFDNGRQLVLTGKHPLLVNRKGDVGMIRAEEVKQSDQFFDREGFSVNLENIETEHLPTNEVVINFASDNLRPVEHIIVANSIQVGDNLWQQYLDVLRGRLNNRGVITTL